MKKVITIVGGGTAGWMAATLINKVLNEENIQVQVNLVESPEISTIGVGEGSTPQLKNFFQQLGIAEYEWMKCCQATYKLGIKFSGWSSRAESDSYFHPFISQVDDQTAPAFFFNSQMRRKGADVIGHPDTFFLNSYLAKQGLSPIARNNFPFETAYGYHFDAGLLGQFLRDYAVKNAIKHIQTKVENVHLAHDGSIAYLETTKGELQSDIFIDCTGFNGLLIQKALKVPFIDFSDNLFNDSAVVLPTESLEKKPTYTGASTLKNGWLWSIPLRNRTGSGYVYSSQFTDSDLAETELRNSLGLIDSEIEARHIKMKVGRIQSHWYKNCLAVGLSQGFIEPLEATALHLVQETIQNFCAAYKAGNYTNQHQSRFNQVINNRFEGIRDYIVAHYRVNSRNDSEYWRANANNNHLSNNLVQILQTWMAGDNITQVLEQLKLSQYYASYSWHCLLAGYGIYPDSSQLLAPNEEASQHNIDEIKDFITRCSMNFLEHQEALDLS
ncbi:tryptophan halogenase family protein [Saccharobesus litoralis]|nr:tryptophan halogenase family protein [Saccharobesus litoralis]